MIIIIIKINLNYRFLLKFIIIENIEFINYMLKTWIEGEGAQGPLFKIAWWNHWKHLETRTNNTNEAYNFRLVVKMGTQLHPNIWLWVEFIQEENLQMTIKFALLETYRDLCPKPLFSSF